jgi:cystathionine beta-lyase
MGGLRTAVASFSDERLLARFNRVPSELLGGVNRLGCEAVIAAWDAGDEWVDTLVALFDRHRRHLVDRLTDELPEVRVHLPEATFLAWLDLSALGPEGPPGRWLSERTGVSCKSGPPFGVGGENHVRMTFGTSTAILDEMLDRLVDGLGA